MRSRCSLVRASPLVRMISKMSKTVRSAWCESRKDWEDPVTAAGKGKRKEAEHGARRM